MALLVLASAGVSRGANEHFAATRLAGLGPGKDALKTFERTIRWESLDPGGSSDRSYDEQCSYQTIDIYAEISVSLTKASVSQVGERIIAGSVAGACSRQAQTWPGSAGRLLLRGWCDDPVKNLGQTRIGNQRHRIKISYKIDGIRFPVGGSQGTADAADRIWYSGQQGNQNDALCV